MDANAIDYEQIDIMHNAIDVYKEEVETRINDIVTCKTGVSGEMGFYGADQARVIDEYINAICNEISSIVTRFNRFKDALNEVKEDYENKQASIKTAEVEKAKEKSDDEIIQVNRFS